MKTHIQVKLYLKYVSFIKKIVAYSLHAKLVKCVYMSTDNAFMI